MQNVINDKYVTIVNMKKKYIYLIVIIILIIALASFLYPRILAINEVKNNPPERIVNKK